MSDLISRKALCDDLREYKVHPVPISSDESEVKGYNDGIDLAISVIAEFPSAEPEPEEFEWCSRDESPCKEYDQEKHCCHRWTKVIRQTVEELKAAEPERKKGEWVDGNGKDTFIHCSVCGREAYWDSDYGQQEFDFCPYCGADMTRGE